MKWFVLFLSLFLAACSEEANVYGEDESKIPSLSCPLVLTIPTVNFVVNSLDPLPPNLIVMVGGDNWDLDECSETDDLPYGLIRLNTYRTNGNLYVPFWPGSEDHKEYFPNGYEPARSTVRVRIFSRAACGDDPLLRYEFADVQVTWTQIFAAGDGCSGGGYSGASQLQVQ